MNRSCSTCQFVKVTNHYDEGQCRRHAPKQKQKIGYGGMYELRWPLVSLQRDWCGDYKYQPPIKTE